MSSSFKPVLPPDADSSSSCDSPRHGGGVRLDAGDFPAPPSQLPQNFKTVFPTARDTSHRIDGVSSDSSSDSSSDCSYVEDSDAGGDEDSGEESDDEGGEDDETDEDSEEEDSHEEQLGTTPTENTPNAGPMTEFARRLSLSVTRSRTGVMVSNDARINVPAARSVTIREGDDATRPVTFKEGNEAISDKPNPAFSPAKTLGERRLARRAVTFGENVALSHRAAKPLSIQTNLPRQQLPEVDAQGVYPPTACVFVANLPQPEDDKALEAAVTRAFCIFGTVFVKIRRDHNDMPFAFCQYTKDEDAVRAMVDGKGTVILGRPCRTEMVKANKTFVVSKRNRTGITVDEARTIMEQYGTLIRCEPLDEKSQNIMKLPEAVVAEYVKFDATREASTMTRQNLGYEIDALDSKMRAYTNRVTEDEAFLKQYEADRRSVYVAGLPTDVDEEQIARYFQTAGEVISVEVIRRRTMDGSMGRVFAFVEFTRIDCPDIAVAKLDNTKMRDSDTSALKVQRKEVRAQRTPKRILSINQLEARFDRTRLSSPRSFGNMKAQETAETASYKAPASVQPKTPIRETQEARPIPAGGATQQISPTHFGYPGYHGQSFSPAGYVANQMQVSPGIYGAGLPSTPPGFGQGMHPYLNGPFWPAAGGYPIPDQPGMPFGYMYGTSPTFGGPQNPFESPVHRRTSMGQDHPGVGHPGLGYPFGGPGYHAGGHDNSAVGFLHRGDGGYGGHANTREPTSGSHGTTNNTRDDKEGAH